MKRTLTCLVLATSWIAFAAAAVAQDSEETLLEQQKAREAELNPSPPGTAVFVAPGRSLEGPTELLFIGVDDTTVSTYVIDPLIPSTAPAFTGFAPWGAAVIPSATPGDAVIYFNSGSTLYRWDLPAAPETCCTLMFSAATASVVSMAYDPGAGELLFTRNITTEAVYSLPVTAGSCPASCDLTQDIVYSAADNDFGGLAFDPSSGILYGTNDDGSPGPAGVYEINGDGTTTLVVAYPNSETDIDGLALGNGRLYLVTDQPGDIYVYNIGTASFETPIANPWTSSEVFAAAAAGTGVAVPVELESFTIE